MTTSSSCPPPADPQATRRLLMEQQFQQIEQNNDWNELFQEIRDEADRFSCQYSSKDSRKRENRDLNRYRDVTPYDHSRVRLSRGCDYINASLVQVEQAGRRYILTQGPLQSTIGHFWLMVWEYKSKAVLMLNGLVERGAVKCDQYWPQTVDQVMSLSDVKLQVCLQSEEEKEHFVVRKCLLTDETSGESRQIFQFHYTAWPDFGLPESPASFLEFLFAVRATGSLDQTQCGPPVVHCSAGIGRSGTLCLVDSCLLLMEKQDEDSAKINVKNILIEMRRYRMGLIQTPEQLRFSFMAIIAGMKLLSPVIANGSVDDATDVRLRTPGTHVADRSVTNNNSAEDRERIRAERKRKTEEKIRRIKDKSKEMSDRAKLKSKVLTFGLIGAVLVLGAGLVYGYFLSGPASSPASTPTHRSLLNLTR